MELTCNFTTQTVFVHEREGEREMHYTYIGGLAVKFSLINIETLQISYQD